MYELDLLRIGVVAEETRRATTEFFVRTREGSKETFGWKHGRWRTVPKLVAAVTLTVCGTRIRLAPNSAHPFSRNHGQLGRTCRAGAELVRRLQSRLSVFALLVCVRPPGSPPPPLPSSISAHHPPLWLRGGPSLRIADPAFVCRTRSLNTSKFLPLCHAVLLTARVHPGQRTTIWRAPSDLKRKSALYALQPPSNTSTVRLTPRSTLRCDRPPALLAG